MRPHPDRQIGHEAGTSAKPGFYIGGNVYADWASVPENDKLSNSDKPDPHQVSLVVS